MRKTNELVPVETVDNKKLAPVVAASKKSVAAKAKKSVVAVDNATATNKKVSAILSFDDTMALMQKCGIGSKSHTKNYRIMNGGSSIHVLKTMYRLYVTGVDFDNCKNLKSSDLQLLENDNAVDVKRPHTIVCRSVDTLKSVFNALALNTANKPC